MQDGIKRWVAFLAGLSATIAGLVWLAHSGATWDDWVPATSRGHCFNELERTGSIAQPSNTWSNLGFVIVGLLHATGILGSSAGTGGASRAPLLEPWARAGYGLLVAALGWTSMFFHASITLAGEFVDMYSMILFTSFVVCLNLGRTTAASRGLIAFLYVAANAIFAAAMLVHVNTSLFLFIGLSFGILLSDAYARRKLALQFEGGWLLAAVGCCLASFGIWILDAKHLLGSSESWFQGHAVWHLGQSLTCALLFQHYARERATSSPPLPRITLELTGAETC
jgi:hypothetical protein